MFHRQNAVKQVGIESQKVYVSQSMSTKSSDTFRLRKMSKKEEINLLKMCIHNTLNWREGGECSLQITQRFKKSTN